MTVDECAIVMAYTGVAMLTGDRLGIFYKYVEQLLGYPVWTHELPALAETIREKAKPDFIRLCQNATE